MILRYQRKLNTMESTCLRIPFTMQDYRESELSIMLDWSPPNMPDKRVLTSHRTQGMRVNSQKMLRIIRAMAPFKESLSQLTVPLLKRMAMPRI